MFAVVLAVVGVGTIGTVGVFSIWFRNSSDFDVRIYLNNSCLCMNLALEIMLFVVQSFDNFDSYCFVIGRTVVAALFGLGHLCSLMMTAPDCYSRCSSIVHLLTEDVSQWTPDSLLTWTVH